MSLSDEPRFHPNRWMRRILGPIFGAACLAATCTGVVVLALLLGSILSPRPPGTAGSPVVRDRSQSRRAVRLDPEPGLGAASRQGPHTAAGISGRDRGQSVAAGSGRA